MFVLLTGPVESESRFQSFKRETHQTSGKGSIFAYHGSSIGNWHSILRMGIKVFSNTKYMSAGAAYGAGAYFADTMSLSAGYCRDHAFQYWTKSALLVSGGNNNIMAICELINRPTEFRHFNTAGGIRVLEREEYISTRFLLVGCQPNSGAGAATATSLDDVLQRSLFKI